MRQYFLPSGFPGTGSAGGLSGSARPAIPAPQTKVLASSLPKTVLPGTFSRYLRYLLVPTHLTPFPLGRLQDPTWLVLLHKHLAIPCLPSSQCWRLDIESSTLNSSLWSNWWLQAPGGPVNVAPPTDGNHAGRITPVIQLRHQSHDSHQIGFQNGTRGNCPSRNPDYPPEPLTFCSGISKDHMSFRGATSIDCLRA